MRRPLITAHDTSAADAPAAAVDSLQRGLEVLRCFLPGDEALDTAELARRLSLSRPTTRRLLDTLAHHGFLLHMPGTDRFGLHVSCLIVGQAVLGSSVLARSARPLLQPFAERLGVSVVACVQERSDMLVMAHATGPGSPAGALGPGLRLPVAGSSLGHAWLWKQRAQVQAAWLARLRGAGSGGAPGRGAPQVAGVYKAFQELEERGVCKAPDTDRRDVTCFASPVAMPGRVIAVVGCMRTDAGGRDRMRLERECAAALAVLALTLADEVARPRAPRPRHVAA